MYSMRNIYYALPISICNAHLPLTLGPRALTQTHHRSYLHRPSLQGKEFTARRGYVVNNPFDNLFQIYFSIPDRV